MSKSTISDSLQRQFERVWESLREAIGNCPDRQWKKGDPAVRIPVRQACHMIGAVEMYAGEKRFAWDRRFGRPVGDFSSDLPAADLPGKDETLEYLDEMRAHTQTWLGKMSDEKLLSPQRSNRHTGDTYLERVVYMLRHSQHHRGEMNAELRRRGLAPANWQ